MTNTTVRYIYLFFYNIFLYKKYIIIIFLQYIRNCYGKEDCKISGGVATTFTDEENVNNNVNNVNITNSTFDTLQGGIYLYYNI